jgi:hypothetical protein
VAPASVVVQSAAYTVPETTRRWPRLAAASALADPRSAADGPSLIRDCASPAAGAVPCAGSPGVSVQPGRPVVAGAGAVGAGVVGAVAVGAGAVRAAGGSPPRARTA